MSILYSRSTWHIDNTTGGGVAPGSGFQAQYDLDPVDSLQFESSFRVASWYSDLVYGQSIESVDRAQYALGTFKRLTAAQDSWHAIQVETGKIEGTVTTTTASNTILTDIVDTTYLKLNYERRWPSGYLMGARYSELAIPSVYSMDDPSGPVIAYFDTSTQFRTVEFIAGYDSAFKNLYARDNGFFWDFAMRVFIGVGSMKLDKNAIEADAASFGYDTDIDRSLLSYGALMRIGAAYSQNIGDAMIQISAGARSDLFGYRNSYEAQDGDRYSTLHLDLSMDIRTYGAYIGLRGIW